MGRTKENGFNPGPTTKPQEIPKTFRTQTRPKAEF